MSHMQNERRVVIWDLHTNGNVSDCHSEWAIEGKREKEEGENARGSSGTRKSEQVSFPLE